MKKYIAINLFSLFLSSNCFAITNCWPIGCYVSVTECGQGSAYCASNDSGSLQMSCNQIYTLMQGSGQAGDGEDKLERYLIINGDEKTYTTEVSFIKVASEDRAEPLAKIDDENSGK
jgi:hypothetical protein